MNVRSFYIHGNVRLIGTFHGLILVDESRNIVKRFSSEELGNVHIISNITYYNGYYYLGSYDGGLRRINVKQKPGSYIAITRTWNDGDIIKATYPMSLHLEKTPDNPKRAALLYGPVVLAGEKGTEGMQAPAPFSNPQLYNDYYTYDYHVPANLKTSITVNERRLSETISRPDNSVLHFTSKDGESLRPLYDIHRQRYVVYWNLK